MVENGFIRRDGMVKRRINKKKKEGKKWIFSKLKKIVE